MSHPLLQPHPQFELEIRLFGQVTIFRNGQLLESPSARKVDALIAYLALQNAPVQREHLAELLWSEGPKTSAINNLRVLLNTVRNFLQLYVKIGRHTVELNRGRPIFVDVLVFEAMLSAFEGERHLVLDWVRDSSSARALAQQELHQLEAALTLYQEHFLLGLRVLNAPEFELWMESEQERLRQKRNMAMDRLVIHYLASGQFALGLPWARLLVQDDPLNEEPQRKLITLLVGNGQRNAAREAYEDYVALLQRELGAEPDPETVMLYRLLQEPTLRLRPTLARDAPPLLALPATGADEDPSHASGSHQDVGAADTATGRSVPRFVEVPNNLRAPLTPFIGRETELAYLEECLSTPTCRLITLTGLGGVGKTRLAMRIAHKVVNEPSELSMRFRDGVYFVSLAAVENDTQFLSTVAAALNVGLQGENEARDRLVGFLYYRHILLILDNFEHLEENAVNDLLDLLERAPNLALLVTSRIRLQLQGEHLVRLEGLPYHLEEPGAATALPNAADETALELSVANAQTPSSAVVNLTQLSAAYHLFVSAARRIEPAFVLTEQTLPYVRQICTLVSGVPLGVELAAALVEQLPCQQIAMQIKRTLDALESTMRDVPLRHRSLRAVFEYSWNLLAPSEKPVYAHLALFRQGFSADAAAQVAFISSQQLQSLLNKSLLQAVRDQDGQLLRYEIHNVLHPFLLEKLEEQPETHQAVGQRHTMYFAKMLERWNYALQEQGTLSAFMIVQHEGANLQAAWDRALAQLWLSEIEMMVEGLAHYYLYRGPFGEAEALFVAAVERLQQAAADASSAPKLAAHNLNEILSDLLTARASFLIEQGKHSEAIQLLGQSLELLHAQQLGQQSDAEATDIHTKRERKRIVALQNWGKALIRLGEFEESRRKYAEALEISQLQTLEKLQTGSLLGLGTVALLQSNYPLAEERYTDALQLCRAAGNREIESSLLVNLGIVQQYMGDYSRAKAYYESGLAIERESGNRNQEALSLMNLGTLFHHVAAYAEAQLRYTEVLKIYQQMGKRSEESRVLANLALLLCNTQDYEGARRQSERALRIAREVHQLDSQAYALTCLGHALTGLTEWEQALQAFQEARELRMGLGQSNFALEAEAGMAFVYHAQGDSEHARTLVEHLLIEMERVGLAGVIEPNRLRWVCYQILHAAGDARATELLRAAYENLHSQASKIGEPELRASFWENSPIRTAIIHEFEQNEIRE